MRRIKILVFDFDTYNFRNVLHLLVVRVSIKLGQC